MAHDRMHKWYIASGAGEPGENSIPFESLASEYASVKANSFNLPVHTADNIDLNRFNPLSKVTSGNPWTVQYENQNRLNEIKLDVDRTFQDMAFFRKPEVQKSLIDVLFVFGKVRKLSYRQGMNEICAIVYHIVSEGFDAESQLPVAVPILVVKEAVAYAILSALMMKVGIADFFYAQSVLHAPPSADNMTSSSPLLERCDKIFDLLCQKDQRLHKHLVMNDISPNLFLVRWIRLWFSREFSFASTILVWDFILNHIRPGSQLDFPSVVDYLAIAMLVNVRQSLLASDNSGCFTLLLKYPPPPDLGQLLDLALQVQAGVPVHAPVVQRMPAAPTPPQSTRRDRVVSDLAAVIQDLKKSEASRNIQREIAKLEEIVKFLKI